ncbi:carbamate kinase, partial [Lachnotalea glycerini]
MKGKRMVVALGGNALGNTPEEQLELVKETATTIVNLVAQGHEIIVGHGNGPQIGMLNTALEYAAVHGAKTPFMPFPECNAMTQGYIGYHLQQAVRAELQKRGIKKSVVSVVTQVVVDKDDPAFSHPTKPIGAFYTKEEAEKIEAEKGFIFMEDAGRGYRRVVPSPLPQKIVELDIVEKMIEDGFVVIATGGGGVPVVETEAGLEGIAAVIDKDKTCAKLAEDLNADCLLILTAVDRVCINFNKPNQQELAVINQEEAYSYINEGQFAPGSMLPKVEACLQFVDKNTKRE